MSNKPFTHDGITRTVTWDNLKSGDVGNSFEITHTDCSVHVYDVFSGAAVTMQGSNDPRAELGNANYASAEWFVLQDNTGTNIVIANSGDGKVIAQSPRFIRPKLDGGDGSTNLKCVISRKGN